jgi:hypothetical protein
VSRIEKARDSLRVSGSFPPPDIVGLSEARDLGYRACFNGGEVIREPALHRPPGDVELADVGLLERLAAVLRTERDRSGMVG